MQELQIAVGRSGHIMSTYNQVKTEFVSAANLIRRAVSWSPGSDWALAARVR